VEKRSLLEALQNCSVNSEADAAQIIALRSEYPFSQVLQVIAAKVSKDYNLSTHQEDLQKAAVYSSDRFVLKDIMTEGAKAFEFITEAEQASEVVQSKTNVKSIEETISSFDVADSVVRDLKRLNQLKHNFEMLFADQSTVSLPVDFNNDSTDGFIGGIELPKSRKEKIIELAKSVGNIAHPSPVLIKRKKRENPQDTIIDQIKTSKEELAPESERHKKQIEIIDHFIKTAPSISNARDKDKTVLPPSDITFIKTGEFSENIVSETLVDILIKQGKKERAIEVLKKLIWKYPQKKAYFASQIEDLKK
jgi:hypothetical protein